MTRAPSTPDLPALRKRLELAPAEAQWGGIEELLGNEPRPAAAEAPGIEVSRRDALRVMAAALAMGSLASCGQPGPREGLPYVEQPEGEIPGQPKFYATAWTFEGYAQPVLGECHVGRPTKLEGNPDHPLSGGASDLYTQAAVLQLYDPDRSPTVRRGQAVSSWAAAQAELVREAAGWQENGGAGARLLTGTVTSPTLLRQVIELRQRFPELLWHHFEPIGRAWRQAGTEIAFGRVLDPLFDFASARAVVVLGDDPLGPGPAQLPHLRQWAEARRRGHAGGGMPVWHVAESTPSLTGAVATTRLPVSATRLPRLLAAVATGLDGANPPPDLTADEGRWAQRATQALAAYRGEGLLIAGPTLPPEAHALVHALNQRLGNSGRTVRYIEPVGQPVGAPGLDELMRDINAGKVRMLLMIDVNPAYSAPGDIKFADILPRVPLSVHVGMYDDETARLSRWHVPLLHPLEGWSDARTIDGTATVMQPLVRRLYQGVSAHRVLSTLLGRLDADDRETVRETWRGRWGEQDFEDRWQTVLVKGMVPDSAAQFVDVAAKEAPSLPSENGAGSWELVFRPDIHAWDGRFANNAWLQEIGDPFSKITWRNAALISPRDAERLGVENGRVLRLKLGEGMVEAPAWIQPGQAQGSVTVSLGYGRQAAGRVGDGQGYDAYPLRRMAAPWLATDLAVEVTDQRLDFARLRGSLRQEGRQMVREVSRPDETVAAEPVPSVSLYEGWRYPAEAWGMVIDLDLCAGCNACIVACQAENNVPVVGEQQVSMGRAMHWLRVDRYFAGPLDAPTALFQPVPCMHCEKAPCEVGCPVYATVHTDDGLNAMVYNRCIGTRTCAAYCPYEVRRFNFFAYAATDSASLAAQRNPDVTVRSRGVMEKCTYCVQRIAAARIAAQIAGRPIGAGEVTTACQQACPTRAIVFGNLNNPSEEVTRLARDGRNYTLLAELNTRPRTTYLARIRGGEGRSS